MYFGSHSVLPWPRGGDSRENYRQFTTSHMKKLFVAFLLTVGSWSATYGQAVTLTPTTEQRTEEYCQLSARPRLNGRFVISIDYGQQRKVMSTNLFRDAAGKAVEFNSPVDALNWLNGQGWELASTFVLVDSGDSTAYYVLRRRVSA